MKTHITKSQRGFTLVEVLIAAFIGLILMAATTSILRQASNAIFTVTERAETQQNMRAAIELMTKDLSLAGAGLPTGGLQLPNNDGAIKVACNQTGTCYVPADVYPASSTGTENYMYGILPGYDNGVESSAVISEAPAAVNDSITSIYCDYNFSLSNFTFTFNGPPITEATVTVNNTAVSPNNIQAPGGLQVGDLLLFTVTNSGTGTASGNQGTSAVQTGSAVAEITGLPAATTGAQGPIVVDFNSSDALNFNQTGANSLATLSVGANSLNVCRLFAVTYFLQVPTTASSSTVQTPRLMRQVNGLTAVPVADNIINLQFSFDVINSVSDTINANVSNPVSSGLSPALIQKVNLWVMGQGVTWGGNRSQSMYLASSVSARNMSFCNSFSSATTVCQ